jgi:hypothetical protein
MLFASSAPLVNLITPEVSMYRIELSPGEETAFRSIEELAVAIRRKVVTSRARIYHNATSKWLPIQFHPHYKIALTMPLTQADLVAGPPVAPLSTLKLGDPQSLNAGSAIPSPSNREAVTQAALAAWPEPKPVSPQPSRPATKEPAKPVAPPRVEPRRPVEPTRFVEPKPAEPRRVTPPPVAPRHKAERPRQLEPIWIQDPAPAKSSRQRRKGKRSLSVALAGAVLIAGVQLIASGTANSSSDLSATLRTPRKLIMAPLEAMEEDSPRTVAAVMPGFQSIPVPGLTSAKSKAPVTVKTAAPAEPIVPVTIDTAAALSSPEIEAAPEALPVTGVPVQAQPGMPTVVDSTAKKAMKGILRSITGTPAPKPKATKH